MNNLKAAFDRVLARAQEEPDFRCQLLAEPETALKGEKVRIPEDVTVKVLENTTERIHLVIPPAPQGNFLYRMPGRSAAWSKVVARAWHEASFCQRLLATPRETLSAEGMDLPRGVDIQVHQNETHVFHLVLPRAVDDALDDALLERISAGGTNLDLMQLEGLSWSIDSWL